MDAPTGAETTDRSAPFDVFEVLLHGLDGGPLVLRRDGDRVVTQLDGELWEVERGTQGETYLRRPGDRDVGFMEYQGRLHRPLRQQGFDPVFCPLGPGTNLPLYQIRDRYASPVEVGARVFPDGSFWSAEPRLTGWAEGVWVPDGEGGFQATSLQLVTPVRLPLDGHLPDRLVFRDRRDDQLYESSPSGPPVSLHFTHTFAAAAQGSWAVSESGNLYWLGTDGSVSPREGRALFDPREPLRAPVHFHSGDDVYRVENGQAEWLGTGVRFAFADDLERPLPDVYLRRPSDDDQGFPPVRYLVRSAVDPAHGRRVEQRVGPILDEKTGNEDLELTLDSMRRDSMARMMGGDRERAVAVMNTLEHLFNPLPFRDGTLFVNHEGLIAFGSRHAPLRVSNLRYDAQASGPGHHVAHHPATDLRYTVSVQTGRILTRGGDLNLEVLVDGPAHQLLVTTPGAQGAPQLLWAGRDAEGHPEVREATLDDALRAFASAPMGASALTFFNGLLTRELSVELRHTPLGDCHVLSLKHLPEVAQQAAVITGLERFYHDDLYFELSPSLHGWAEQELNLRAGPSLLGAMESHRDAQFARSLGLDALADHGVPPSSIFVRPGR